MSAIDQLLRLTGEYQRATGFTDATVSTHLFNDGKKLSAIKAGKDVSTRRLEAAIHTLSVKWPAEAVWPDDIARPEVVSGEAAA
ncbi:MAG: hypothetical protein JWQ97_970 [Phenylobacterium sp.]|nr:hypothetical protein [Phenylobacterium sp.]